jgi:hypothetical protein
MELRYWALLDEMNLVKSELRTITLERNNLSEEVATFRKQLEGTKKTSLSLLGFTTYMPVILTDSFMLKHEKNGSLVRFR